MRVRFHQRRIFQASQDGDYRHHAARIDGKTDDGTAHLVSVDLAGTMEQFVEQEVELFMLGMGQLQGKQSPKRQLVQRVFHSLPIRRNSSSTSTSSSPNWSAHWVMRGI